MILHRLYNNFKSVFLLYVLNISVYYWKKKVRNSFSVNQGSIPNANIYKCSGCKYVQDVFFLHCPMQITMKKIRSIIIRLSTINLKVLFIHSFSAPQNFQTWYERAFSIFLVEEHPWPWILLIQHAEMKCYIPPHLITTFLLFFKHTPPPPHLFIYDADIGAFLSPGQWSQLAKWKCNINMSNCKVITWQFYE